jgi:hypothetical protein
MSKLEDEFVNDPVNPDRATNQLQVSVGRIVEDEIIAVELG